MKRIGMPALMLGVCAWLTVVASAQPGDEGDKGKGKKGPPRYEIGSVMPPFVRDQLELTDKQRKQLSELEREVGQRLRTILTAEQLKRLQEGAERKGPPDGKGRGEGPPNGPAKIPQAPPPVRESGVSAPVPSPESATANLVKNPVFANGDDRPEHYVLQGDVEWVATGGKYEFAHRGAALSSGKDLDGDGERSGSVSQEVAIAPGRGKWFRFSFRGLAENNFAVDHDALAMKIDFLGKTGPLDGVTRKIYPQIEKDRVDLAENGKDRKGGGAVWKTYQHDFMLPFAEIDRVRLSVAFRNGAAKSEADSRFYATEFSLLPIADPVQRPKAVKQNDKTVAPADLVPLGGRWYYLPDDPANKVKPAKLVIDHRNADRLFYLDDRLSNPFAENMTAWLLKGYLDRQGGLVTQNRLLEDNIVIRFEGDKMIVQTKNLPNHPTAAFPALPGSGDRNPNSIQEQNQTFYLPLEPKRNANPIAMDKTNSNRALNMGAVGFAINGVVFYNPFDAGIQDATDLMDRCCGHPSPDNRYHYHKYPVCVKSPFVDEGNEHSPLIGFAFDGFPIYGPYVDKGVMAKDAKDNPLNEFNVRYDDVRGWHYHVTPGRFPYIIGGYWGDVDSRNIAKKGPRKK